MSQGPEYDVVVDNALLLDGSTTTLAVRDGHFVDRAAADIPAKEHVDAGGCLVTPAFVNAHMHLDKVYTLPMLDDRGLTAYTSGTMGDAATSIELASAVKRSYRRDWILPNVRRALDEALRHGVLHVQAFVDVDTTGGLEGMHAVLTARAEYAGRIDLQVVAFPQDGVVRDPGAAAMCEQALDLGADVVGGIPWIEHSDAAAREHVEWACALARERGLRVAMLVDDAGDPTLRTTQMLADQLLRHDLVGRGVACHARAVGTYEKPSILRLAGLAREAGLAFVSDPHTGPLHLPVRTFLDQGLDVALGQDDIEDAYYPWGRHNMLEVAFLAGHLLGFRTNVEQRLLVEMVTTRAAAAIGLAGHGLAVGDVADFCLHGQQRVVDLLREHEPPRAVYRRGRLVARTAPAVTTWGGERWAGD
ncbi:amidohydrolase family protein [Nocardioides bigeumensis]|uniref:Amidohydrolase family protein n=1 Tax=Nocardioides bigeumensis TaxID=433657 RepID=A0ABP5JBI5_9ACTN